MYFWDESTAGRGPEEIASCLFHYIIKVLSRNTKKVILYSKSSPLYRNAAVTLMLNKIFNYLDHSELVTLEQRFFIRGHGFNSCNHCFGIIDKKRKTITEGVFSPKDWINLISDSKRKEPKFVVFQRTNNHFYSVDLLMKLFIDDADPLAFNENSIWSKYTDMIYKRNEPFNIYTKNSNDDTDLIEHSMRQCTPIVFQNTKLIYKNEQRISKWKNDNMQNLLRFIPDEHKEFYKSLKFSQNLPSKDFTLVSSD